MKRLPLLVNIILFCLLCVIVSFLAMRIFKPNQRAILAPITSDNIEPAMGQWGALFGQSAIATAAPSNYQLKGVIVANDERDSVAIIFVEGKPTYAIGIGKELSSNVKLQEVHSDHVIINESGIPKRVDLPHGISPSVGITPAVIVPNFPKNTALAPRS